MIAYTNVDKNETYKKISKNSNILFPQNLARAIKRTLQSIFLIHLSTDQVYNGRGNHLEKYPDPLNFYGFLNLRRKVLRKCTINYSKN